MVCGSICPLLPCFHSVPPPSYAYCCMQIDESTFERPMYAGNAVATVTSTDALKLLTVRSTAFEKAAAVRVR